MTPTKHAPEIQAAIERMEQNTTWGKFLWSARPWNTTYYAFTHRYVSEQYLLRRYASQLKLDGQLDPA